MADGLGLGGGAAASKRATCLPRRGPANVGTEGPTHHATVQDAPPQNPVLPVEVGSIGQPPELAPPVPRVQGVWKYEKEHTCGSTMSFTLLWNCACWS